MGHLSDQRLLELSKSVLLCGDKVTSIGLCEHCSAGKQRRVSFSTSKYTTREILEYVHSDLWRTTTTTSFGGNSYVLTFIDDYSKRNHIIKQWKKLVENVSGK